MAIDRARTLTRPTLFYCVDMTNAACSIADDIRKDVHLMVFALALATPFRVSITQERDYQLSHLVMVVFYCLTSLYS